MGPFATAVLLACLTVLGWLFYIAGGLLALLVIVQQIRGTDAADPLPLVAGAAMMILLGWISRRLERWLKTVT